MQNNNYVFFNATDAAVQATINNVVVGAAYTAADLATLLRKHNVNVQTDTLMHSSDVDFASEEGFSSDDAAHNLIDEALQML
jgi:hypothetical protein